MILGTTSVPQALIGGSTTIPAQKSLGKDDFLRLLVAQLAAQDPLDPMSAQDFSAQLAQFSALEQLTNVNVNLEQIKEAETAANNVASINLIGKRIESPGNSFNHKAGFPEILSYSLAS
ncbi:MAG: flagellar hook assembly protein FlgD, partial [Nitrospinae bacterium]|nr:flagellar hook assembly protein FlgD [Nitrospinota bacterium]